MPPPDVIVITGPPGSGKSTTARLVAQRFERAVCLESDWFWTSIVTGLVAPWRPEADAQNRAVLRAVAESAATLADSGYVVVVDGVIGPWYLDLFTAPLGRHGIATHYVVLRPDIGVTLARVTARSREELVASQLATAFIEEQPAVQMWEQFADLGELERHVVDNSGLDAPQTAALVLSRYSRGTDRL